MAYHNQFHKAFPGDKANVAKQLWLHSLLDLSPEEIIRGCRRSIRESAYLPTLHTIRELSKPSLTEFGLPDPHSAYLEACRATSPKADYNWSHIAVYHAGRAADWYFLANNAERTAFPVFKDHYLRICQQVLDGEELALPSTPALPQEHNTPLSLEERREKLRELRKELGL
ncbi:replication protein P [Litorivivens sp.]|uniref:replication protein P n=1 Tax=Litorivivens sp. TaxID=2020868 RepID=UPI00356B5466